MASVVSSPSEAVVSATDISALYSTHLGVDIAPSDIYELPASSQGEFNKIYRVSHSSTRSFLRISKPLIPHRKTQNEVASLALVHQRLPPSLAALCPKVLAYDDASDMEWTILSEVPGVPILEIFDAENEQHVGAVVRTIIDLQNALWETCRMQHLGGLRLEQDTGAVLPGPMVTYDMWDVQKLKHIGPDATFEEWNPTGPFDTEMAYISARLQRDLRIVQTQPSCAPLRGDGDGKSFAQALDAAIRALEQRTLLSPGFALSHRDLHLGNFLGMKENDGSIRVTGIIDWELAQCVPLDKWEPFNTLWHPKQPEYTDALRSRLFAELNATSGVYSRPSSDTPGVDAEREAWWSLMSLSYWIVYRTVNPEEETRMSQWMEKFWKIITELRVL
ncbi:hypothetical protein EXIGLDRAFT_721444 [Exidia glandulosa HHB12029]|uniref:Aminoglycoside phosphotransferase domain-containing protein n=1 Tax=Exidia glandulosa HHB12029 TaxID=1314781 RepID=A0A165FRQ6_EXIGL|nr:hypothetical protein EXIGLDRAFT_721444 [Exidia glandulosa HHB12029]